MDTKRHSTATFDTLRNFNRICLDKSIGSETFTEAFRYMDENGMEIAGQPRTSYIDGIWNQEDPEKWVSLIQIPIR